MKKNYTFHKRKVWIVFFLCLLMILCLIGRLIYLMGFRSDYYYEKRRIFMNGKETLRPHVVKLWTQREKYLLQIKQCVRFL